MKRNYVFISIGAALLLLLSASSCGNLQMPETVSVKSNAKFQAPLGTAKAGIPEKFGPDSIRQMVQDRMEGGDIDIETSIYPYAKDANDDVLRYLIRASINPLPDFNIGDYLNKDVLEDNIPKDTPILPNTPIPEIPDLSRTRTITYPVSEITDLLADNDSFTPGGTGTTLYEGDATIYSTNLPEVNVSNGTDELNYEKVYYSDGSVQVTMNRTDSNSVTDGYVLMMKAYLVPSTFNRATDNPDDCIAKSNNGNWQNIIENPTLTIPLNVPEGIPMEFKFVFLAQSSGGNPSVSHIYAPTATYEDLKVKRITNLNSTNGINFGDQDIPLPLDSMPSAVKEIIFNNASITAKSENPEGWSGVSISFASSDDFKFVGTGGALGTNSITETTPSGTGDYLINKAYKASAVINPQSGGTVTVHVKPTLTISNATIDFGSDGNSNQQISAEVMLKISKIDQIKVDLTELGVPDFNYPIPIPEQLKYVKQINFTDKKTDADGHITEEPRKGFGLKCKVTNTLPEGNDLSFNLKILKNGSNGYDKVVTIPAGLNETTVTWTQKPCTLKFPAYEEGVEKYLDISASLDDPENFILKNVEPKKEYELAISIDEFVLDWDSVELDLSDVRIPASIPLPDMSGIFNDLPIIGDVIEKIEIKELPFYMYAKKPTAVMLSELLGDISLNGTAFISFKQEGNDKYLNLFDGEIKDSEPSGGDIGFKGDIPWPSDQNQLIVGNVDDISNYLTPARASLSSDLKNILSLLGATDLMMNFNVGLNNGSDITVYQTMMPEDESEGSDELNIDMAMILSCDIGLKAPITLDIMELTNEDYNTPDSDGYYSDLLNREPDKISTPSEFDKYIDAIKEVGIRYQFMNELFINDDAHKLDFSVNIDDLDKDDGYTGLHKRLELSPGSDKKITFDSTEIKDIMTHRFHPNITLNLGRNLADGETTEYSSNKPRLTVSRSGLANKNALSANVIVYVQMNGDEPIQVWGGQE